MTQPKPPRIVDAHIHWWDLDNNYYPWLSDQKVEEGGLSSASALAKSYLPEHYWRDAEGYNIVGLVHVQANWDPKDPVGETRWLQQLADSASTRGMPQGIVVSPISPPTILTRCSMGMPGSAARVPSGT